MHHKTKHFDIIPTIACFRETKGELSRPLRFSLMGVIRITYDNHSMYQEGN